MSGRLLVRVGLIIVTAIVALWAGMYWVGVLGLLAILVLIAMMIDRFPIAR